MPATQAQPGAGSTLSFAGGFFAEKVKLSHDGIDRPSIDATHLESPDKAREYIPDHFTDWGSIGIEGNYLKSSGQPPIDSDAEAFTYRPHGDGATVAGMAFLTNFQITMAVGEKMSFTATLKCTGKVTFS